MPATPAGAALLDRSLQGVVGVPAAAKLLVAAVSGGFSFLLSPVGLFAAAVAGLGYLFLTQTEVGRGFLKDIGGYFTQTAANAQTAWAGIVDAVKAGDLELAWATATAFLDLEWKRLWGEVKRIAREGWDFLGGGWDSAALVVKNVWIDLKEFVVTTVARMTADALREMTKLAPKVGDALGGLADRVSPRLGTFLRTAGMVAGIAANGGAGFADAVGAVVNPAAEAERKKAQAEYDAAKATRQAVLGVLGGADAKAVADAGKKLADLRAQAAKELVDKERQQERKPPPAAGAVGDAVRGMFSTFGLSNQFGGTQGIPAKQLTELQQVNFNLKRIYDRVGGRDDTFA